MASIAPAREKDRVKLAYALLSSKRIHRAQIRIQRVEQLVDLLVRQNVLDFIERIDPKGKRNALASIELLQALFHVVRVPDLDVIPEGRIRQNVDEAFVGHLRFLYSQGGIISQNLLLRFTG